MFCNRTLQALSRKGQELEDHYFGAIKERVLRFMQDLELELFRLGIPAKTPQRSRPNQFELAPIYEPANVAADHNQLLMEVMKKVGERHDLAVLLGEKPFAGSTGRASTSTRQSGSDDGQNCSIRVTHRSKISSSVLSVVGAAWGVASRGRASGIGGVGEQ